ncbi:MAG: dipeptidase [Gammaproteobacteria bacterium]
MSALCVALVLSCAASAAQDPALQHAKRLLERTILFDGHNDLPWAIRSYEAAPGDVAAYDIRKRAPADGQTDLPRLREGRIGAQFWSVYTPGEGGSAYAKTQLEQIDIARRVIARYPDAFRLVGTAAEVRAAKRAGRIGSLLGIEGGHAIEDSLGALRAYYDLGVRYMTLTHNVHTNWADSAMHVPAKHRGLSPFGEEVVREMNRLGMLVDLAHTSPETMHDALRVSQAPVIFSHAAARALCEIPRNVPDDVLAKLPANGGVIMVTFVSGFISQAAANVTLPAIQEYQLRVRGMTDESKRDAVWQEIFANLKMPVVTVAAVADHIEHVRKVAGVDHVGIGGDFDGNTFWPEGLSDVSMYPNLFAELIRRGWSDRDLEKLAGENVLRALEQAEAVAKRMQSRYQPMP